MCLAGFMSSLRACLELFLWPIKGLFLWHVWSCFYSLLRECLKLFLWLFRANLWSI